MTQPVLNSHAKQIADLVFHFVEAGAPLHQIEVEARLKDVDGPSYHRVLQHFMKQTEKNPSSRQIRYIQDDIFPGNRRISTVINEKFNPVKGENKDITKVKAPPIDDVSNLNARFAVAWEKPFPPSSQAPPHPSLTRKKHRTSFLIRNGAVSVDFTEIKDAQGKTTQYELEVELRQPRPDIAYIRDYLFNTVLFVRKQLDQSNVGENVDDQRRVFDYIIQKTQMADRRHPHLPARPPNVRDLTVQDMRHIDSLISPKDGGIYYVTIKADGERSYLVFLNGIYIVTRMGTPRARALKVAPADMVPDFLEGTILDGEYVPKENHTSSVEHLWLGFDCVMFGNTNVTNSPHRDRLQACNDATNALASHNDTSAFRAFGAATKTFYALGSVEDYKKNIRHALQLGGYIPSRDVDQLMYKADGLIFTWSLSGYTKQVKDRTSIVDFSATLKWKPAELHTIDFVVEKVGSGYKLYTHNRHSDRVEWRGSKEYRWEAKPDTVVRNDVLVNAPNGTVVEFRYERGKFIALRERPDKAKGNYQDVALEVWHGIHHPVTTDTLLNGTWEKEQTLALTFTQSLPDPQKPQIELYINMSASSIQALISGLRNNYTVVVVDDDPKAVQAALKESNVPFQSFGGTLEKEALHFAPSSEYHSVVSAIQDMKRATKSTCSVFLTSGLASYFFDGLALLVSKIAPVADTVMYILHAGKPAGKLAFLPTNHPQIMSQDEVETLDITLLKEQMDKVTGKKWDLVSNRMNYLYLVEHMNVGGMQPNQHVVYGTLRHEKPWFLGFNLANVPQDPDLVDLQIYLQSTDIYVFLGALIASAIDPLFQTEPQQHLAEMYAQYIRPRIHVEDEHRHIELLPGFLVTMDEEGRGNVRLVQRGTNWFLRTKKTPTGLQTVWS